MNLSSNKKEIQINKAEISSNHIENLCQESELLWKDGYPMMHSMLQKKHLAWETMIFMRL